MPLLLIGLLGVGAYWWYSNRHDYKLTYASTTGNIYLEDNGVALGIMEADGAIHPADTQAGLSFIKGTMKNADNSIQVTLLSPTGVTSVITVPATGVVHT